MSVKLGRLKKEEENYIIAHAGKLVPQEMADNLNRSIRQVLNVLSRVDSKKPVKETATESKLRLGLKESALWRTLKAEFEPDELVYFEEQYIALMEQFRQEEVLHTEENQVCKVIKIDIMKHRNAVRQKRCSREIDRCERLHEKIIAGKEYQNLETKAVEDLEIVNNQIQNLYAQQKGFSEEYVKLEDKHQRLMVDLKATREQRVDQIQSGKIDFLGVIRTLCNDRVIEAEDRQIELMRQAVSNETQRLSKPHAFVDGELDPMLLNSDTQSED